MAYLIRRLLENTANSSFLRQSLEERPVEDYSPVVGKGEQGAGEGAGEQGEERGEGENHPSF